ncbi:hypothetical protein EXIGLDRAFT_843275 [Exidia glandulosa HHB12029]|uniref:GST N-terminal domain-containing protein n=1 Tax=Exidia glandulosa HHB12029 TaxID=1314781 RepID=A0A165CST9_EXIGL|nr:hypothetical protein EXIGLDRAFT_843275 [Exidia glandulosa HHB12029]
MSSSSSDQQVITFYDIASKPGVGPWSPNTWKTRLCLNYKRLPYRTEYISYPDIKPRMQALGAVPGYNDPAHGGDVYTLPAITVRESEDKTETIVDSLKIAYYLDAQYPNTPRLIPPGTRALQLIFLRWFSQNIQTHVADLACMSCPQALDSRGAAYFLRTRTQWYNQPLEEWVPDDKRAEEWMKVRKGFGMLAMMYDQAKIDKGLDEDDEETVWIMGDDPTFADFAVAACLLWIKKLVTDRPGEGWEAVSQWAGGRWARFLDKCEPYMCED